MSTRSKVATGAAVYVAAGYGLMVARAYWLGQVPGSRAHAAVITLGWPAALVIDALSPLFDEDQ